MAIKPVTHWVTLTQRVNSSHWVTVTHWVTGGHGGHALTPGHWVAMGVAIDPGQRVAMVAVVAMRPGAGGARAYWWAGPGARWGRVGGGAPAAAGAVDKGGPPDTAIQKPN